MAFSDIRSQISHLSFALQTQDKGKISSQSKASTLDKVEGITVIISLINNNILEISVVVSLRSEKVLDESISK